MRGLALAMVLLLAGVAHAEDKAAAREAYDLGSKYYYLNDFE